MQSYLISAFLTYLSLYIHLASHTSCFTYLSFHIPLARPGQPLCPAPGPDRTHRQAIRRCGRCKPCPCPLHCLTAELKTDGGPPPSTTSAGSTPQRRSTNSHRSLCTLSREYHQAVRNLRPNRSSPGDDHSRFSLACERLWLLLATLATGYSGYRCVACSFLIRHTTSGNLPVECVDSMLFCL